ncbi:hypothetical protein RRG08_063309 [Elysia crispata]|uniref:Uncharacterized protein n=1 Tax=Elysia crispata TaxID=231223 RepID=A0AAE0ZWB9_9GAST|nr:hypothetical protein RRG08_063309 [Elysia crispata]
MNDSPWYGLAWCTITLNDRPWAEDDRQTCGSHVEMCNTKYFTVALDQQVHISSLRDQTSYVGRKSREKATGARMVLEVTVLYF